ncbi:MAG: hypothetical protein IJ525_02395 [Alphaproteobacteria bacterium]|nr:hypothetical protein [Alphaproteobacteria bacterium]
MNILKKFKRTLIITLMAFGFIGKAYAFPLPTLDLKEAVQSVQNIANQIQEIKQQIESNLQAAMQIANEGYAAAANDLFSKISSIGGSLDRFGNNIKGMIDSAKSSLKEVKSIIENQKKEIAMRANGMMSELAKQQAALERAGAQANAIRELAEREMEKQKQEAEKQKSNFNRAYNWLEGNRAINQ